MIRRIAVLLALLPSLAGAQAIRYTAPPGVAEISSYSLGCIPKATSSTGLACGLLSDDGTTITSTGHVVVGSAAAGKDVTIMSTLGAELMPALTGASGVNWTFAGTYATPLASTIEKAGAGTDTITPTAATAIVAGTVYKVVIVTSAFTAGSATYTVGGVTGTSLSTATTTTDYIRATTTGNFILTPTDAARFVISSVSVKALTATTGRLLVSGPSSFYSPLTIGNGATVTNGQLLLPAGTAALPSMGWAADAGTGVFRSGTNEFAISTNGVVRGYWTASGNFFPGQTGTYRVGGSAARWSAGYFGGATLTASTPAIDIATTWNNGAVQFIGATIAATETASASTSRYFQILGGTLGTTDEFYVAKGGSAVAAGIVQGSGYNTTDVNGEYYIRDRFLLRATIGDGIAAITNYGGTNFTRLQLGGTTTAFNAVSTTAAVSSQAQGIIIQRADGTPQVFANLGAATNGAMIYCSDCTIADPCAGSGTGAYAKRLNGVWVCN